MPTKEKDVTSSEDTGSANDPFAQHWNKRLNTPTIKNEDRNTSGVDVAKSESEAENPNVQSHKTEDDAEGGFYKAAEIAKNGTKGTVETILKSRKGGAGMVALIISIVLIVIGVIGIGPLKYLHFAEWLQSIHFSDQEVISNQRIRNMIIYARLPLDGSDGLEKTRLGYYANKRADKWDTRLADNGLKSEYKNGKFTHMSFDKATIADDSKFKDLKNLEGDNLKKALSSQLDIDPKYIKVEGGSVRIEAEGTRDSRRIITSAMKGVGPDTFVGKAMSSLHSRVLIKRANVTFNPITRLKEAAKTSVGERYKDFYDKRTQNFTNRTANIDIPTQPTDDSKNTGTEADEKVSAAKKEADAALKDKTKLKGLGGKLAGGGAALAVLGVLCASRDISSEVSKTNYANKIGVAIEASGEVLGIGSKIQDGFDVDLGVLGEYDKMYGNYAASPSYRYENGDVAGEPLFNTEYPEFNPDTQGMFDKLDNFFDELPGVFGAPVDVICGGFTFFGNITSSLANWATLGLTGKLEEFAMGKFLGVLATEAPNPLEAQYIGTAVGGELAGLGTRVNANEASAAKGGRPLSNTETAALKQETTAYLSESDNRPYFEKFLDFTDHRSPVSKTFIALNTETSKNGTLMGSILFIPKNIGSIFTQRSSAADVDDAAYYYGIPKAGFEPSKLASIENPYKNAEWVADNLTLSSDAIKKFQECTNMTVNGDWSFTTLPYPEGIINYYELPGYCMNDNDEALYRLRVLALDTAEITSYSCVYEEDQEACGEYLNETTYDSNDGSSFRSGTYNLLGNKHTEPGGKDQKLSDGPARMAEEFAAIKTNQVSVVGLQELEEEQRDKLIELMAGQWGIHPQEQDYNNFKSSNSIIWNSSVFELADSNSLGYLEDLDYLNGSRMDAPWVKLRHKQSGQVITFQNTHDPVDNENTDYRISNAKRYEKEAQAKEKNNDSYVLMGDFNSSYKIREEWDSLKSRKNLTYCILTENGALANSYDTVKARTGACPTEQSSDFKIDHIYHTTNLGARIWQSVDDPTISDHPLVYADIVMANSNTVNAEGWAWPLQGDIKINSCFAQPLSKGPHPGLDFKATTGTPVFSAADGVVYGNPGGSYGIITIKHTTADGQIVYSVYEHMSKFDVGKDSVVKAGQQIGLAGSTGTAGAHLHFGITKDPAVFAYADMGKGQIYNPLVFVNANQSYEQCSVEPAIQ